MLRKFLLSIKSDNIYFDHIASVKKNNKKAIVFIHGLGGSRKYWDKSYFSLSESASLYFIDLLGFGFSNKPNINYTLENHIYSLRKFIRQNVKEKEIILIGHSLGAIVSLGYMSSYPDEIKTAILMSIPHYHSEQEAKKCISNIIKLEFVLSDNLRAKITCALVCFTFGSITRSISPLFIRDLPAKIVRDVFRHSYNSYISTLINVIYKQNLEKLFNSKIKNKLLLVHGAKDRTVPLENINELVKKHSLDLKILNAGHRFPIKKNIEILKIIEDEVQKI